MEGKLVITVTGKEVERSKCRFINKKYYLAGRVNEKNSGDCYKVTDSRGRTKYTSVLSGKVIWNLEKQRYLHTSMNNRIEGVGASGDIEMIVSTPFNVIIMHKNRVTLPCESEEVALALGYRLPVSSNIYYPVSDYPEKFFTEKRLPESNYKSSLDYGCENVMEKYTKSYEKLFKIKTKYSKQVLAFYDACPEVFNKYTFGVEFETTRGMLLQEECDRLGLMPLRDGSITGIEYATIPLKGKKGLYALVEAFELLKLRTDNDFTCSMHVHVGGIERSKENITAFFNGMYMIQSDMYKYFPGYKENNANGAKRQNYTSPLPLRTFARMSHTSDNTEEDFGQLATFLTNGVENYIGRGIDTITHHPRNDNNNRKWNMRARYLWFNLIPIIFTNKKTVEYRVFSMPDTTEKMLLFLSIALGTTYFMESNSSAISRDSFILENYTVSNIMNGVFRNSTIDSMLRSRRVKVRHLNNENGGVYEEKQI